MKFLHGMFLTTITALTLISSASSSEPPIELSTAEWSGIQQAYLKASNTEGEDYFGSAVAMSGDTLVIGAHSEASSAVGINGNTTDNSAPYSGAVYVFIRNGTNWNQQAYLKASNTDAHDVFGYALDLDGDTLVVGAYGESSSATGTNGNQADDSAMVAGAAYVFVRNGTNWSQQAYLKASNTEEWDAFGLTVAIAGDTIAVGAGGEQSNATGVNGNQTDNNANWSGAAYVFVRNGTAWSQQAYLKASNTDAGDHFGHYALTICDNTIVVGASGEDSHATGVNGNQLNNSAESSGAAYIFVRNETTWSQQAYLKASNTDAEDRFGISLANADETVVVGAAEDSNAVGVNGNQTDNSASRSGAVYVFVRSGTTWSQQAYLKASNTEADDEFSSALAIEDDTLAVGAWQESSSASGINGNQTDNGASEAGAVYLFVRSGTTWSQQAYLKASNTDAGDLFGGKYALAIEGNHIVVGAHSEDSASTGVNGNPTDNSATGSGAVYIFFSGTVHSNHYTTITGCAPVPGGFMLEWMATNEMVYVVEWSPDLVATPFTNLSAAFPYPQNSYTDTVHGADNKCFYRVELQHP